MSAVWAGLAIAVICMVGWAALKKLGRGVRWLANDMVETFRDADNEH